jgi:hypothetical protein
MAFKTILGYTDEIEQRLAEGQSPRAIANALGIPKKWMTINRYKKSVFDVAGAAQAAWDEEKKKTTEDRLDEGVVRIIDSLELLNLAKLRAYQLMELDLGGTYQTSKGEKRTLSPGAASTFWPTGEKMACEAIRTEQEIAGDDPETRKADTLLELLNAVNDREESGDE